MDNKTKLFLKEIKSYEYSFTYGDSLFTFIAEDFSEPPSFSYKSVSDITDTITHFHTHYELFYVYEGKITLQLENQNKVLTKGDLLIVSPEYFHKIISNSEGNRYILNFVINKSAENTNFKIYPTLKKALSEDYLYIPNAEILYNPLHSILNNIKNAATYDICLNFYDFVTNFLKLIKNSCIFTENMQSSLNSKIKRDHNLHYLLNNCYNTDVSIDEIAKKLHLSTRQTNRIIHKTYNCGFREIIRTLRMSQAATLLINTDMSITDIAQYIGYSSICGFYNAFSKHYSQKPLEYRKSHSKSSNSVFTSDNLNAKKVILEETEVISNE